MCYMTTIYIVSTDEGTIWYVCLHTATSECQKMRYIYREVHVNLLFSTEPPCTHRTLMLTRIVAMNNMAPYRAGL